MDKQEKRKTIVKKLNEYSAVLTPGQMTKIKPEEITNAYRVYIGRDPNPEEVKVYENHPDDKMLRKDLSILKKRDDKALKKFEQLEKSVTDGQGGIANNFMSNVRTNLTGQGGPMESGMFTQNLQQGASDTNRKLSSFLQSFVPPSSNFNSSTTGSSSGTGMRTDRHNNPTAFTTDVAKNAGLVEGVDFVSGDPFPDNPNLRTAKILKDPISTTIKVIDRIGFKTGTGKPRWTYISQIPGIDNWKNLDYSGKAAIIAQMYKHEGGSGKLVQGAGGPKDGRGGLRDLGNVTSRFGQQTRDTSFHTGVDVANQEGTPIPKLSGVGGVVTQVGSNGDYGNQVTVRNDDGTTERYSHLKQGIVVPGQRINPGQVIGPMGKTGNSWSPTGGDSSHLHYEISDVFGQFVNPENYI
ncbi:M23 family metallopeptidase [Candidatus Dojkabacteria bacterium]|jgi:hypothetical protein|nr:M23 family metallopeptidase [Candidatus Dojkabacteria bacterium]